MKRGANATTSAPATNTSARSTSLVRLELVSERTRADRVRWAARGSFRNGFLNTPHRGLPEEPGRLHEEDAEDDGEAADEPHVAAPGRPVRAEQVEEDAEREPADDGAHRAGQAAEHRRRERVEQDPLHHVRIEEDA